jgi:acetylornithine deacetylase
LGVNAIYKMSKVVLALERYQRDVLAGAAPHRLCGPPSLSVGTITGGLSVNTVPDQCVIDIDRRLVPGEKPDEAYRHVLEFVARQIDADPAIEHEPPYMLSSGLSDDANGPLARELAAAGCAVGIGCETMGVPYGTNASSIAAAGVPSVVFGPGSIDQAHTADEWVALDQVALASEAIYQFARGA